MRKILVIMLVFAMCGALSAESMAGKKKKKTREVEATYMTPALGMGGVEHVCPAEPFGCVFIPVEKGEKYVTLEMEDQSGQPVYASVYTYGYTDGLDSHEHICASSDAPLALAPGLETLAVVVTHSTSATAACEGVVTTGTIKATFSNRS